MTRMNEVAQSLIDKDARIAELERQLAAERERAEKADSESKRLCYDLAARLGNAGARAATAEARLLQEQEAVRVLGIAVRPIVGVADLDDIHLTWDQTQAVRDAIANPLAAAAIKETP